MTKPLTPVAGGPPCRVGQRLQFRKGVLGTQGYEKDIYLVLKVWLHDDYAYLGNGGGGPVHWRVRLRNEKTGVEQTTGIGRPETCGKIARALPALTQVPAPLTPTGGWGKSPEPVRY